MPGEVPVLAERIRTALARLSVTEQRMFGGATYMLNGNMLCCASKKGLMVRVGKAAEAKALSSPHAQPCLGTGRRMPGFVLVDIEGLASDKALRHWLGMATAYVETLHPKPAKKTAARVSGKPVKTKTNRKRA